MKKLFVGFALLSILGSCKKDNFNDVPANFYFIITNGQGSSLFTSITDEIAMAYLENSQLVGVTEHYHPYKNLQGATVDFMCGDRYMANKSQQGIKTFYLTFQGKTDTLGLDIRRVPATPDNGGNSTPIVTFNGRPMQSAPGGKDTPDYFVLKRR